MSLLVRLEHRRRARRCCRPRTRARRGRIARPSRSSTCCRRRTTSAGAASRRAWAGSSAAGATSTCPRSPRTSSCIHIFGNSRITSSQISRVPDEVLHLGQEAEDLVAARAAAGAELEAAAGEVVEHRDLLRHLRRVVHLGERVEDARAEVDALGACARGSRGTPRWPRGASTRRGSGARSPTRT